MLTSAELPVLTQPRQQPAIHMVPHLPHLPHLLSPLPPADRHGQLRGLKSPLEDRGGV